MNMETVNKTNDVATDLKIPRKASRQAFFVMSFLGMFALFLFISSVQSFVQNFGDTFVNQSAVIDRIPPLSAVAFGSGWFAVYFTRLVQERSNVIAKLLTFAVVFAGILVLAVLSFTGSDLLRRTVIVMENAMLSGVMWNIAAFYLLKTRLSS